MEQSKSTKRPRKSNEYEKGNTKKVKYKFDDEVNSESNEGSESGDYKNNESADGRFENEQGNQEVEEKHFVRLFKAVLDHISSEKHVNRDDISRGINLIISSFRKNDVLNLNSEDSISFSDVDLTKWENICAYLLRFGAQGAGLARFRILNVIQNCKRVEEKLKKEHLKIICFGAGPGNDAIGFGSALTELRCPKSLKIILVDKFEEWRSCIEQAKKFIEGDDFGKISNLFKNTEVKLSFIKANLEGYSPEDQKYLEDLKNSDVIITCRLLTNVNPSPKNISKFRFAQMLKENMKEDAVILLIDKYFEDNWEGFERIYSWGDKEEDKYIPSCAIDDYVVPSKMEISVIVSKKKNQS